MLKVSHVRLNVLLLVEGFSRLTNLLYQLGHTYSPRAVVEINICQRLREESIDRGVDQQTCTRRLS